MLRRTRTWLLTFALLGLGASLASLYIHYRMLQDPAYSSFCNFNDTINCEVAYQSRFGSVRGVPIALGGVIWFTFLLLVTLGAESSGDDAADVPGYLFVLSTPALAVVLFLAYASIFILKAVCILCVITYLAVIGMFLVSGSATSAPLGTLPRRASRDLRTLVGRPLALTVAILFLAGAASAVALFPKAVDDDGAQAAAPAPLPSNQRTEFERWFAAQPRAPIVVPADGARVVIVKFNDYQCPACAQTYKDDRAVLAGYQAEHPGAVKLVMKDFPLEPECNATVLQTIHQAACEGAVAVRLAQRHQRGAVMEEWLYTHQEHLTPPAVRQAARDVGGVTEFDSEYAGTLAQIKDDVELGRRLGVKGTPTFFINGVKVEGGLRPQYLDAAIAHELSAAGPAKP